MNTGRTTENKNLNLYQTITFTKYLLTVIFIVNSIPRIFLIEIIAIFL